MAVKKGYKNPGIGSHGTAVAVSDVSSSLSGGRHPTSTFKPDPSDTKKASGGAKVFKFPLDDVSAGNFWTRLIINTWVPTTREQGSVKGTGSGLDKDSIANIWLPMPMTLSTSYNQNYSEAENMLVTEGTADGGAPAGSYLDSAAASGAGIIKQMVNEVQSGLSDLTAVNSSGKMAKGSIQNNKMGLVYDGASLRSHTLNWRMIPKTREEQKAIQQICFAFKKFSSPVVKGILGGDTNIKSSAKAHELAIEAIENAGEGGKVASATSLLDKIEDSMASIGRLGIPVTVNVEFWFAAERNRHLFQIKDSFIQSVEVNYTPTGVWNAYEDGAPIETGLTVVLKENAIITANDIQQVGGF